MADVMFLVRATDGLILAETREDASHVPPEARWQATQLFAKLQGMGTRTSIEVSGGFMVHLLIHDSVCFMGIFSVSYPKNLAFIFLEEIRDLFQEELKREFGTFSVDYRSHIDTLERPYHFVGFERQINRKRNELADPRSPKARNRIRSCWEADTAAGGFSSTHAATHAQNIDTLLGAGAASPKKMASQGSFSMSTEPGSGMAASRVLFFGVFLGTIGLVVALALQGAATAAAACGVPAALLAAVSPRALGRSATSANAGGNSDPKAGCGSSRRSNRPSLKSFCMEDVPTDVA